VLAAVDFGAFEIFLILAAAAFVLNVILDETHRITSIGLALFVLAFLFR
jgi:hypothetical protein